jgi:hypothetical protein
MIRCREGRYDGIGWHYRHDKTEVPRTVKTPKHSAREGGKSERAGEVGMALLAELPTTHDNEFGAGQFFQPHRSSRMNP